MGNSRTLLFYAAIAVAVIAVVLCIYYSVPGPYHILVSSNPNDAHRTHAIGMGAIAVLAIIAALVMRPKSVVR